MKLSVSTTRTTTTTPVKTGLFRKSVPAPPSTETLMMTEFKKNIAVGAGMALGTTGVSLLVGLGKGIGQGIAQVIVNSGNSQNNNNNNGNNG